MPRRSRRSSPFSQLTPEIRRSILMFFTFVFAILLLLSLVDMAGTMGLAIDRAMAHVFGWNRAVVPFFLIAYGFHLYSPDRFSLSFKNYLGTLLYFLSFNGLFHVLAFRGELPGLNALGAAGGKIGALVSEPLLPLLGLAGSVIVFAAVLGASIILVFNTSLDVIIGGVVAVFNIVLRALFVLAFPFRMVWGFIAHRRSSVQEAGEGSLESAQDEEDEVEEESDDVQDSEEDEEEEENSLDLHLEPLESGGPAFSTAEEDLVVPETPIEVREPRKPRRKRIDIPAELFEHSSQEAISERIEERKEIIRSTLENFGIEVEMGPESVGPTVTQFTFKPEAGIPLNRIVALHNDLALELAAHPIRIEAPIPNKNLVGIEVPNKHPAMVSLRECLFTREWRRKRIPLRFAVGKDVVGNVLTADISKMPHLLVAGSTGSGKSVCLNSIIMSLVYSNSPDDLKLVLIDPKLVEFSVYQDIPHLISPIVTDVDRAKQALQITITEMNKRFEKLSVVKAKDIATYNKRSREKMPYWVVIMDELADLISVAKQEIEAPIVRLAQKARAVGIHLVLATQRPSVNVLTGVIKANVPSRIAFAVASQMDSRTILDQVGANKLLGRGDMLFQTGDMASPKRIQGVFVSDEEVSRVVDYLKTHYGSADYDARFLGMENSTTIYKAGAEEGRDAYFEEAWKLISESGKGSASLLQRRLKVGYARAARILDELEEAGVVGPASGAKPRKILKKYKAGAGIPVAATGMQHISEVLSSSIPEESFDDDLDPEEDEDDESFDDDQSEDDESAWEDSEETDEGEADEDEDQDSEEEDEEGEDDSEELDEGEEEEDDDQDSEEEDDEPSDEDVPEEDEDEDEDEDDSKKEDWF